MEKKFKQTLIEDMLYLPSGKFLKGAALGYDEMLADVLWIKAIGYYGGHAKTDQDYRWLYHIINVVTILDPLFQYPYEFGGIVMSEEMGQVDKSLAILQKGMENVSKSHKRYWYLPFFTAFNYMYYKQDYRKAAIYLEQASKFPGRAEYLPLLVARLYANADSSEVAVTFLQEMIKSTKKQALKERLIERLHQVIHRANLKILNQGIDAFYLKFHKYPSSLQAMVNGGILSSIPVDPRGGKYYISADNKTAMNTIPEADLTVHINKKKKPSADDVPLPMQVPEHD